MYTALGEFYDLFMDEARYPEWVRFILKLIGQRKKGADVGCGTGKITLALQSEGCDVFGMDQSPEMLSVAAARARGRGMRARFVLGDMQTAELNGLDFVTAVCDVINYIQLPAKAFANVYRSLNRGGVFIFDVSSEYKLRQILGGNTYSDTSGDITYIWHNFLNEKKSRVEMELTFFKRQGDVYQKTQESQVQYIHKTETLLSLLQQAGFEQVGVYGDYGFSPIREQTERICFVAQK